MLTCLECGKDGFKVLKHTHWRFKCTGKIKNAIEYQEKYPNAPIVSEEIKKKISHTRQTFIKRWGIEEGNKKWLTYCQKHSHKNTLQGYLDKGASKDDWLAYNAAKAATRESFKRRYGAEADNRWEKYVTLQQTNGKTLDWFITKLGYDTGVEFYYELNKKKGITPSNMIRKWGHDEGLKRWHAWIESTNGKMISNMQREIISKIIPMLPLNYIYHEGAFKSKEFAVWSHEAGRAFMYDFVVTFPIKVCIEINGSFYHADPRRYTAEDRVRIRGAGIDGVSASSIWEKDAMKKEAINKQGYELFTIWEHDWNLNKNDELEKIISWLKLTK